MLGYQYEIDNYNSQIEKGYTERKSSEMARVVRVRDNGTCDVILANNSKELREIPAAPESNLTCLKVNDSVIVTRPEGCSYIRQITARCPYEIPEETVYEFRSSSTQSGNIYLCIPSEGKFKTYSLSGVAGIEFDSYYNYNVVYLSSYLYEANRWAYTIGKVKTDGSDFSVIYSGAMYYDVYGLAINPEGTYLYQATATNYIARIDIEAETVNEYWKEITEGTYFAGINDICSDSENIYVLGYFG